MPRACTCQSCSYRVETPETNCRYGSKCSRSNCWFAHPSPSYSGSTKRLAGDDIGRCHHGILCTDISCEFAHPSPALKCHDQMARQAMLQPTCPMCNRVFVGQFALDQHLRHTCLHRFLGALARSHTSGPSNDRTLAALTRPTEASGSEVHERVELSGPAAENLLEGYDNGEEYGCLICLATDLQDPMLANDGRVYCKPCIVDWFTSKRPPTSPLTNLRISEHLVSRPRRPRPLPQQQHTRSVHVDIPVGFDTNLLRQLKGDSNLRRYLQRQYGVTIISAPSSSPAAGACSESLVLTMASNMACEDALDVAKAGLEEFLQNPSEQNRTLSELVLLQSEKFYVFVDYSNIASHSGVRVSCKRLNDIVVGLRQACDRVLVGSYVGEEEKCEDWRELGYQVHMKRRPEGAGEQFVDDALIAQMLNTLISHTGQDNSDKTLVLLSGDGNDNEGRVSFRDVVEQAIFDFKWNVEVWCWKSSCARTYRELQEITPAQMRVCYLDASLDPS